MKIKQLETKDEKQKPVFYNKIFTGDKVKKKHVHNE
jgi:hypothetical protein